MAASIDSQGVWTRRVPRNWIRDGQGRTDIHKTVLSDPCIRSCRFFFEDGPTVVIPAEELRRVVEGGCERYSDNIWGPFNIDPGRHTVDGHKVLMQALS